MSSPPPVVSSASPNAQRIVQYFEQTARYYQIFWATDTGALHFGMRSAEVVGHQAELLHTNRVLADAAAVRTGARVLDAGCGIGGSACWLARDRGATVVGVTLSPTQAQAATATAVREGLDGQLQFHVADYCDTGLPAASFDVVWALESSCYAADKTAFLREAFRLLRPGGGLVIADGVLGRPPAGAVERRAYAAFLDGLVLPPLASAETYRAAAAACGFTDLRVEHRGTDVRASSRRLFWRCLLTYPLARLATLGGRVTPLLLANSRAGIAAYPLLAAGVLDYALLTGRRAHRRYELAN